MLFKSSISAAAFARMLDSGLLNFANEVAEVGDRAGKEYGLEKTLNKMKAQREAKSDSNKRN